MKHGLASLMLALVFAQGTIADELFPLKPIEETPIEFCNPGEKSKLDREVLQLIRGAQKSLKCGNYEVTYEQLQVALEGVQELMIGTIGWCYSKDNCGLPKLSAHQVTKKECESTLAGESWKPVSTPGACQDI